MKRNLYRRTLCSAMMLAIFACFSSASHAPAQESPAEALTIFSDAANFQNNAAYALAVKEWESFLKQFPDDALAGKAQHYLGVCQLQLKEFEKAAAAFAVVVKDHPKLATIEDAYLNLGWCQYSLAGQGKDGMYAKAADSFADLVKAFPKGKYADQALYFQGESLYNLGKKAEAVKAYETLVKNHKESSLRKNCVYALGVTQEEMKEYAAAGNNYDLFLAEFPEDGLATEVRMRKAETVLQAGNHAEAEKMFGEVAAVEGFGSVDHAVFRQAFCAAKQEKFEEAGKLYARIPTDFDKSVYVADATISAARAFYRGQKYGPAKKWLQKVVDADTKDAPEAAHWLCRIQLQDGKAKDAVALVGTMLPKAGESTFLVNLKMDEADALYESEDTRAASLEKYLAVATDHGDHQLASQAMYYAAYTALDIKEFDQALKVAQDFATKYPEDSLAADVSYVAAESNLQLKNYADAEKQYRELTAKNADHKEIEQWWTRLGLALYLQKKYEDVESVIGGVAGNLQSTKAIAECQFLIGASQFFSDKFPAAITSLNASLKADPKWRQADETLLFLARAQHKQEKTDAGLQSVQKLLKDFPESTHLAHAHYRHGEFSYAKKDYDTAIAQYDLVSTAAPDSPFTPYAHYGKGWSQIQKEDFAGAEASMTSLISGFADHKLVPDSQFARAMSRRQQDKHAEAVADIDAFLGSNPGEPQKSDALYEKGLAEVSLKKFADAAKTFDAIVSGNPNYEKSDKVIYELAWAHKSDGKDAKAVEQFTKLTTDHADSSLAGEAFFHVGEAAYDKKQFDEAVKSYAQAKQKAASDELGEKACYKLGWSHFQLKKYEPALAEFTEQADKYKDGGLYTDSLFMKAETLFRMDNFAEALPVFKAANAREISKPQIKILVLLHGGQSAAQVSDWDGALAMLEEIPKNHADTPYLAEAHYELGWAKQNKGSADDAMKDYAVAATKNRTEVGCRARFMMGELLFEQKKFDEAIEQFQRAMYGYGGANAGKETKNWQAKSGYEAGRCADVQIKSVAADKRADVISLAKKSYEFVVKSHPKHELVAQAQKRLDALATLK